MLLGGAVLVASMGVIGISATQGSNGFRKGKLHSDKSCCEDLQKQLDELKTNLEESKDEIKDARDRFCIQVRILRISIFWKMIIILFIYRSNQNDG